MTLCSCLYDLLGLQRPPADKDTPIHYPFDFLSLRERYIHLRTLVEIEESFNYGSIRAAVLLNHAFRVISHRVSEIEYRTRGFDYYRHRCNEVEQATELIRETIVATTVENLRSDHYLQVSEWLQSTTQCDEDIGPGHEEWIYISPDLAYSDETSQSTSPVENLSELSFSSLVQSNSHLDDNQSIRSSDGIHSYIQSEPYPSTHASTRASIPFNSTGTLRIDTNTEFIVEVFNEEDVAMTLGIDETVDDVDDDSTIIYSLGGSAN